MKATQFLLVFGLAIGGWAQELSNKVDVMITPTCSFSATTGLFHYGYQIQSKPTSLQAVWDFTVEVPEEPNDGHSPTGWSEFYSRTSAAPSPIVSWVASSAPYRISPGATLTGFVADSFALPGVVRGYVKGYVPIPRLIPGVVPPVAPTWPENSLKVFVIGPLGKATMTPLQTIDYLVAQKHAAANMGWISNQGIVNSLDQKLENARAKIQQGDNGAAKNMLGAFLNELEAQRGKKVNDAAFTMLHIGAEWLISKLP